MTRAVRQCNWRSPLRAVLARQKAARCNPRYVKRRRSTCSQNRQSGPLSFAAFRAAYDILHEAGFSDEAILNEMYLSKEPAEVFERMADQGLFGQLTLHSRTSQYGQLSNLAADDGAWIRNRFQHVLEDDILSGRFAREWSDVQAKGQAQLEQLRAQALQSPIAQAESRVKQSNQE